MKRSKVITLILVFLLLAPLFVFADAINGSSDAVLLMLPRGMTYNKNDAIELTTAKSISANDLGNAPLTFSSRINSADSKNVGVIRFQDTLHNMYLTVPSISTNSRPYVKSNYSNSDEMFQTDNTVVLRIHTTGIFVNEEDPTITRDFSLSCVFTEAYIKRDGSEYTKISGYPTKMTLNNTMTSSDTVSQTYFRSLGGGDYELYIPATPIVSAVSSSGGFWGGTTSNNRYYPLLMRIFDICIELPGTDTSLPSGYYKTEITIQSVSTYKNRTFTGEKNDNTIETEVTTTSFSETITVWGYVGNVSGGANTTYSFSVSPTNNSYSINLGTQTYYNVAQVNFYNLTGPYTSSTAPVESVQKQKYKVYISPTSNYMTAGTYVFKKTNSNDTIPYDLYLDENGTLFSSNSTNGIGGSGVGSGSIPSSTYYVLPVYSITKDTMYGASTKYTEIWNLANVPIYLKVTEDNQSHSAGEYRSNIYFTLVIE